MLGKVIKTFNRRISSGISDSKHKHWRGLQAENAGRCAPMLVVY